MSIFICNRYAGVADADNIRWIGPMECKKFISSDFQDNGNRSAPLARAIIRLMFATWCGVRFVARRGDKLISMLDAKCLVTTHSTDIGEMVLQYRSETIFESAIACIRVDDKLSPIYIETDGTFDNIEPFRKAILDIDRAYGMSTITRVVPPICNRWYYDEYHQLV